MNTITILVSAIITLSLFSGCIQSAPVENDKVTASESAIDKNALESEQIQNYTANLTGHIYSAITGWQTAVTMFTMTDLDMGKFNVANPEKIMLIVTYNSTYGDVAVELSDPDTSERSISWYSENDGGGVETVVVQKEQMSVTNGYWFFRVYGGVLPPEVNSSAGPPGPAINIKFNVKIIVCGCPITDAYMNNIWDGIFEN